MDAYKKRGVTFDFACTTLPTVLQTKTFRKVILIRNLNKKSSHSLESSPEEKPKLSLFPSVSSPTYTFYSTACTTLPSLTFSPFRALLAHSLR